MAVLALNEIGKFGFVARIVTENGLRKGGKFKLKFHRNLQLEGALTCVINSNEVVLSRGYQFLDGDRQKIENYIEIGLLLAYQIREIVGGVCSVKIYLDNNELIISVFRQTSEGLEENPVSDLKSKVADIVAAFENKIVA